MNNGYQTGTQRRSHSICEKNEHQQQGNRNDYGHPGKITPLFTAISSSNDKKIIVTPIDYGFVNFACRNHNWSTLKNPAFRSRSHWHAKLMGQ